jgi:hypothetical protein
MHPSRDLRTSGVSATSTKPAAIFFYGYFYFWWTSACGRGSGEV